MGEVMRRGVDLSIFAGSYDGQAYVGLYKGKALRRLEISAKWVILKLRNYLCIRWRILTLNLQCQLR